MTVCNVPVEVQFQGRTKSLPNLNSFPWQLTSRRGASDVLQRFLIPGVNSNFEGTEEFVCHTHTRTRQSWATIFLQARIHQLLCIAFSTSNQNRRRLEYVWHFELSSWANMQHAWQFKLCQACGFTAHCCSTSDANSPVLWTKQFCSRFYSLKSTGRS